MVEKSRNDIIIEMSTLNLTYFWLWARCPRDSFTRRGRYEFRWWTKAKIRRRWRNLTMLIQMPEITDETRLKTWKMLYFGRKDIDKGNSIEKTEKIEKKFLAIFHPQGPPRGVPIFQLRGGISKIQLMVFVSHVSGLNLLSCIDMGEVLWPKPT